MALYFAAGDERWLPQAAGRQTAVPYVFQRNLFFVGHIADWMVPVCAELFGDCYQVRVIMRLTLLTLSVCVASMLSNLQTASAGFYSDRSTFNGAAGSVSVDTFDAPDHSLSTATGGSLQTNSFGVYDFTASGLTHEGVRYVGNIASTYHTNYPVQFPSLNETYIYNAPSTVYSLNGTANLFAGRESVDVYLSAGTTAFGTDIGFDTQTTSLYSSLPESTATMDVTVYYTAGGSTTTSIHVDGTSRFFGFVGSEISHIHFGSLLPSLNPSYLNGGIPGYYSYTLFDNVAVNLPHPVPEPSAVALCAIGALGLVCVRRKK